MLDATLRAALDRLLAEPAHWVHLGTVGPGGGPHVTPVLLGRNDEHLYLSVTGTQKKRNLQRDDRVCLSVAQDGTLAHVVVWGRATLRHDAWAQERWEAMIAAAFGPDGLAAQRRTLSLDGTSLGVVTPERWRIYRIDGEGPW